MAAVARIDLCIRGQRTSCRFVRENRSEYFAPAKALASLPVDDAICFVGTYRMEFRRGRGLLTICET